jgi:D-glycero-alpha-D-manno-heptose-7-phosphate kinase
MIITRTPLRISLGGGGTDLPSYYRQAGSGFLIAAAITKYVFIAVNHNFDDDILLKYSQVERVADPSDVKHPILREALLCTGVKAGVEVSSMADIPAGTGLGSSGAFTVGVLKALWAHRRTTVSNRELARQACAIEIDRLHEPVGKQDQYIAAVGGITAFEFHADERVDVIPLDLDPLTLDRLDDNMLLFYTGMRRSASAALVDERRTPAGALLDISDNLDAVKAMGRETRRVLEAGDVDAFAALLTDQWDLKLARASNDTHRRIDAWIRAGLDAGALGGKLIGAGGGGFLLFYADSKADLRAAMAEQGLEEVRFSIDYEGAAIVTMSH